MVLYNEFYGRKNIIVLWARESARGEDLGGLLGAFETDGTEVVRKFIMLERPKRKAGGNSGNDIFCSEPVL